MNKQDCEALKTSSGTKDSEMQGVGFGHDNTGTRVSKKVKVNAQSSV